MKKQVDARGRKNGGKITIVFMLKRIADDRKVEVNEYSIIEYSLRAIFFSLFSSTLLNYTFLSRIKYVAIFSYHYVMHHQHHHHRIGE
jgi:hypothetical protein